jgi:transposase
VSTPKRRLNDAFLAEIARQHAAHVKAGWPAARAIAVAYGVTRVTASGWLAQCRKRGFDIEPSVHLRHHYAHRQDGEQR